MLIQINHETHFRFPLTPYPTNGVTTTSLELVQQARQRKPRPASGTEVGRTK